ncbi:MAG TPA: hypothetical protein VMD03_04985 [Steroidobacteraceae bacterium]|nr:hypothetical protein [Steroidobacteraceae bacterium]
MFKSRRILPSTPNGSPSIKSAFNKTYCISLALASINASRGVQGLPGDPRTFGVTLRAYD